MTNQEIINKISSIRKGTFVRIKYKTDLPIQASQKQNYSVSKIVEQTVRIGVNYNNIANVKARLASRSNEEHRNYTNPYKQILRNVLYEHEKTGTQYLQFATVPNNSHVKTEYVLKDSSGKVYKGRTKQDIIKKDVVLQSYWKEHDIPEVQKVKVENIIDIN